MKSLRLIAVLACLGLPSCLATLEPFVIKHTGTDLHGITILSLSLARKANEIKQEYQAVKVPTNSNK